MPTVINDIRMMKDFVQDDAFDIKVSHNPVVDLSTAVFTVTLKNRETATTSVLEVEYDVAQAIIDELPATTITTNAALGVCYVPIAATDTSAVPEGEYYGSIKRTIGSKTLTLLRTDQVLKVNGELAQVRKVNCFRTLKELV